jgi:hypothetical protein
MSMVKAGGTVSLFSRGPLGGCAAAALLRLKKMAAAMMAAPAARKDCFSVCVKRYIVGCACAHFSAGTCIHMYIFADLPKGLLEGGYSPASTRSPTPTPTPMATALLDPVALEAAMAVSLISAISSAVAGSAVGSQAHPAARHLSSSTWARQKTEGTEPEHVAYGVL